MKINRYSASAIHLAISLLVFLSFIAVLYFLWIPGDLFFMDGGWQGVKLVAMVDLVLGPLLTLLLFKRGKPSLKFDMSVIASIQIAALLYGFYTTYNQRVVALVYADQRFSTVTLSEYRSSSELLEAKGIEPQPLANFGDKLPVHVFTEPFDSESFGKYLESLYNDFPEIRERNDQYLDLAESAEQLRQVQITKESMQQRGILKTVEKLLVKNGRKLEDIELYPLKARYESGIAVVDPESSRIVEILRHESLDSSNASEDKTSTDTANDKTVVSEDTTE